MAQKIKLPWSGANTTAGLEPMMLGQGTWSDSRDLVENLVLSALTVSYHETSRRAERAAGIKAAAIAVWRQLKEAYQTSAYGLTLDFPYPSSVNCLTERLKGSTAPLRGSLCSKAAASAAEAVLLVSGPEEVEYVCSLIPPLLPGDSEEGV